MSIRVMILLGAPGAGKGTIAEALCAQGPWRHLSTGDLLRAAVAEKTALGCEAEGFMRRGELVPDSLVTQLVAARLAAGGADAAYLLDGFPRTPVQADLLDGELARCGARLDRVLLLDVPRSVTEERLGGRRICGQCGANYHVRNIPPRVDGVCDRCGGALIQRPDDAAATVGTRWEVFQRQTAGLVDRYERQGLLLRVDASGARDRTVADIMRHLP